MASFVRHGEQHAKVLLGLGVMDIIMECLHHVSTDIRRATMRLLMHLMDYIGNEFLEDERLLSGLGKGLQDLEPANQIVGCSLLVELLNRKDLPGNPELVPGKEPLHMSLIHAICSANKIGGLANIPGFLAAGRLAKLEGN